MVGEMEWNCNCMRADPYNYLVKPLDESLNRSYREVEATTERVS